MATSTIVITYTAGATAETTSDVVTSFTVDGTAYSAVTDAQVRDTLNRLEQAVAITKRDKSKQATLTEQAANTDGYQLRGGLKSTRS